MVLPPISMIRNALSAAWRAIRRLFSREPLLVSEQVAARRMALCESCPRYNDFVARCEECKCFVALKTELATEECPLGRW